MTTINEADLTKSLNNLAPTFRTAITATIDSESSPLKRTQAQRDQVDIRRGIYTDMKKNLDTLQSAVQALISTQGTFALNLTAKASVQAGTAGSSVLTATSTDTAVFGEYDFSVSKLAKAESVGTAAVLSPDMALGKSGTFWLGGTGTASVSLTPGDSLTGASTSTIATGQRELGSGNYTVQVRDSGGIRQFRLVNADGTAVSIRNRDGGSYTSSWQNMATGSSSFDTGRGLTLDLSTAGSVGTTTFSYTARGSSINISASDTQRTIASMINAVTQPDGRDFKASIVAGKLVLSGTKTGVNHGLVYQDGANLGFTSIQGAQNAEFTVNTTLISRATNTGLTDVIDGVTLNLASDAEGKTARLSIAASSDKASNAMTTMVNAFNAAFTHLTQKMAITSSMSGEKTTYTRAPLAGDTVFRSLRLDMYNQVSQNFVNTGSLKNLSEIGLSFDKDLKLSFDSTKFAEAMKNQGTDLTSLIDGVMNKFNTMLSRFTGSSGSLQASLTSMDEQLKAYNARITQHNQALLTRKQTLVNQYQAMQSQLVELGYQAQMFGINITGTTTNYSG